jgi:hyperosmotically inducible protein
LHSLHPEAAGFQPEFGSQGGSGFAVVHGDGTHGRGAVAAEHSLRVERGEKDGIMQTSFRFAAALMAAAFVLTGAEPALRADAKSSVEEIRKELLQLPYYGVFDFLAFSYDKGTVTLMGYAYRSTLKHDAARAAKRASGVDSVIDKIEELPVSQFDDELRWRTYYAIYRDPFLSRYAPGGGVLWGHRHPFGGGFHAMSLTRFPGMEPLGDYPLHIIVKNGKITLLGVVDSESDKIVAGMRAREVPGSFGVENELAVEKSEPNSPRE